MLNATIRFVKTALLTPGIRGSIMTFCISTDCIVSSFLKMYELESFMYSLRGMTSIYN